MAGQGLIVGAALVAGYFATRSKSAPASPPNVRDARSNLEGQRDIVDAAQSPGEYTAPTGGTAVSDGLGVITNPVMGGNTSTTPSGDTGGGNTSTTPSGGMLSVPIIGTMVTTSDGTSSDGPSSVPTVTAPAAEPAPQPQQVSPAWVKYRSLSGLTMKQESGALGQEGPGLGLVW